MNIPTILLETFIQEAKAEGWAAYPSIQTYDGGNGKTTMECTITIKKTEIEKGANE